MPEYTAASLAVVVLAAIAAVRLGLHRRPAAWLTLAVFLLATVVFDSLIVGQGIVVYAGEARTGLAVGAAPVEDLLFGAALCLVALTAWTAAGRTTR